MPVACGVPQIRRRYDEIDYSKIPYFIQLNERVLVLKSMNMYLERRDVYGEKVNI